MLFSKKQKGNDDFEEIIINCGQNNSQAQKKLIELYYGFAVKIASKYINSPESMEEIVNDSFLKVFKNIKKLDSIGNFNAWFGRIVSNTSIDFYRKNKKIYFTESLDDIEPIEIPNTILNKLSADDILKLIHALPISYRLVFSMHVIDGYSHKEIAEKLGINEGTSKSNLFIARKKLQIKIAELYPEYSYLINNIN